MTGLTISLREIRTVNSSTSPQKAEITDVNQLKGKKLIVVKGTTAETYFSKNYPDVTLVKFDEYQEAYDALLDGRGDAFSTDNTEVLAWAQQNEGFSVGIESLGDIDTIAPAVQKGNTDLLNAINDEIKSLADEQFRRSVLPFCTAGAIVSISPSDSTPTTNPLFCFAHARTSVLSVENASPRSSNKASYAS